MEITVNKAIPADLPAVGALYGDVCDSLRGKPYNPGWRLDEFPALENARSYVRDGVMLLAYAGGRLAGSIALTDNPSGEDGGEAFQDTLKEPGIWYIHVLAVHPEFQRMGVGARLLAAAEELARQSGVHALRLYVWEHNTPAVRAYEKAGFACIQQGVDIGLAEFGLERFSLYERPVSE